MARGPLGVVVTQCSSSATPGSDAKSRLLAAFPLLWLSSVTWGLSWYVFYRPRASGRGTRVSVRAGTVRVGVWRWRPRPLLGAPDFRSLSQVRPQPLSAVAMSRFFTTGSDSESESSLSGEELVTKPVGGNYGKQ